ncbi:MAG: YceI family protein [Chloroflexi bacterium]|nr:YceI family protein [Chloroflexota bacterium]
MGWQVDYAHSQIEATVRHMMISNVRGRFEKFTVNAQIDDNHPERSQIEVAIDAASVNTKNEQRDGHLKSPDFLDVENFPTITFKSTRTQKSDDANGKLYGDLTIKGITKPVVLNVEYAGQSKSPWGTINAGFTASAKLNRKDWGLNWNAALETGGWLVGDEVKIDIEVEFTKVPETAPVERQPVAA